MTSKAGPEWCMDRGLHRWRKFALGVEQCSECHATRIVEMTPEELASYQDLLDELQ